MKKAVLLAALSLLGSNLVSCDNENMGDNSSPGTYATDDGYIPAPPPPPPPPPVIVKPK